MKLTESSVEDAALGFFQELGYEYRPGPEIAVDGLFAERKGYGDVILVGRLRAALARINPDLPASAVEDAVQKLTRTEAPTLVLNNRTFHRFVTDGVPVKYRNKDGREVDDQAWLFDWANRGNNDWLVVNQFTVVENHVNRRPDVVVFVNGLPLAVIELKNPADQNATVFSAYNQHQTYKAQIPSLFVCNEVLVVSDGMEAKIGSLTSPWERFSPWRTTDGETVAPAQTPQMEVLIGGVFRKDVFLDLIRHGVTFEDDGGGGIVKKLAAYHQYHAVRAAVRETLRAAGVIPSSPALLPGGEGGRKGQYRGGFDFAGLAQQAREMRKRATPAEDLLWGLLRNRQLADAKFRRQHQIGVYVVDFYCAEAKVVVECDGDVHDSASADAHDRKRDAYLRSLGNTVLRFANDRILNDTESVLREIADHLPSPPGRGIEGEGHADKSRRRGDRRIGVIWHTQGSGKSLSMVFYASKIIQHPRMENPTIVVITDRNDLDDQLFRTFSLSTGILRQTPVQAESRDHLKELLQVVSGGVVFTTAQKFAPEPGEKQYPLLSDRRNIVVIADEAHRTQYDFIDGFARHIRDGLPKASFIGFTGTPIELSDRSTVAVFGDHISVYDIEQAVEDQTTVKIYYEGRLAKIELDEDERPRIDPDFEDITETEEMVSRERLKRKWSRLEAMVGTDKRLGLVARDIVEHFERRQEAMDGKAMVVCMSRRICVDLYDRIVKLRPRWDSQDFGKGAIKVVMTGAASDPERYARHLMTPKVRKEIENRFKNPDDPLKIVIVRDMWLTGFDVPCLHTMYVDKPMQGHGLMQTIARVNRVFRDKPGGLIVDYLGIAEELKAAVATYTERGGRGKPTFDQREAVALMLEKHEILCGIFSGFDWKPFIRGGAGQRLTCLKAGIEHVLAIQDGKDRVLLYARQLSEAFALSVPSPEAMRIRDDVAWFQAVRSSLVKLGGGGGGEHRERDVEAAIKQLVSKSVSSDEVVDIFKAVGLDKPDISILSDEFLAEFNRMEQKNLAVEMLKKLMSDEIRKRSKSNLIQSRQFSELLEETIRRYQNRTIEAAAVIEELIRMAKGFRQAMSRGEKLGLADDEVAFYDALGTNDSAVHALGDETLKAIAQELVKSVRRSVTIDWTVKETVRARIRAMVKRILRKHGYPPDKQEQATRTVLEQAELLCGDWAEQPAA
jgi:type I site-specific restriction-modification system R (restriction) subunit/very-short-patch-repair endonuclease